MSQPPTLSGELLTACLPRRKRTQRVLKTVKHSVDIYLSKLKLKSDKNVQDPSPTIHIGMWQVSTIDSLKQNVLKGCRRLGWRDGFSTELWIVLDWWMLSGGRQGGHSRRLVLQRGSSADRVEFWSVAQPSLHANSELNGSLTGWIRATDTVGTFLHI